MLSAMRVSGRHLRSTHPRTGYGGAKEPVPLRLQGTVSGCPSASSLLLDYGYVILLDLGQVSPGVPALVDGRTPNPTARS